MQLMKKVEHRVLNAGRGPEGGAGHHFLTDHASRITHHLSGHSPFTFHLSLLSLLALLLLGTTSHAAVLPEDRADVLYHRYDGGGVQIDGPSLLVRKKFAEKYSVSANYYVDMVSSASIDVLTTASPYKEERTQESLGVAYLRGKTTYSLDYTNSEENDYTANTASFGISQDMFGDLTTLSLGFSRGWDEIRRRGDALFAENTDRRSYRAGLSQVITRSMIMAAGFEVITDEGFLNNPYRSVRYLDPASGNGYSFQAELYPRTRTSNAFSLDARYFLPYRAALHGGVRFFTDTWGIESQTAEIGYTHPTQGPWTFEASFRYYSQSKADFYSDLFPRRDFQNFMARDKELSTFDSGTLRLGASYEFTRSGWRWVKKGSVNIYYDRMEFSYDDFRNIYNQSAAAGTEPLYTFGANVFQVFMSVWF